MNNSNYIFALYKKESSEPTEKLLSVYISAEDAVCSLQKHIRQIIFEQTSSNAFAKGEYKVTYYSESGNEFGWTKVKENSVIGFGKLEIRCEELVPQPKERVSVSPEDSILNEIAVPESKISSKCCNDLDAWSKTSDCKPMKQTTGICDCNCTCNQTIQPTYVVCGSESYKSGGQSSIVGIYNDYTEAQDSLNNTLKKIRESWNVTNGLVTNGWIECCSEDSFTVDYGKVFNASYKIITKK